MTPEPEHDQPDPATDEPAEQPAGKPRPEHRKDRYTRRSWGLTANHGRGKARRRNKVPRPQFGPTDR